MNYTKSDLQCDKIQVMRIATSTLHLPCNYGNALQTFALHRYLKIQGYNTDVLSAWFFDDQDETKHSWNLLKRGPVGWLNLAIRLAAFIGYGQWIIREFKLNRWLLKNMTWSSTQGSIHSFPFSAVNYDTIIVGSDQIWNPAHQTSTFYLLAEFPKSLTRIAYAASLGCSSIPDEKCPAYKSALGNFKAISMRDSSGVKCIEEKIGLTASLVADPTLLLDKKEWIDALAIHPAVPTDDSIFFYFVTPDTFETRRQIIQLAKATHRHIHVFSQGIDCPIFPPKISKVLAIWKFRCQCALHHIHVHRTATPTEFIERLMRSACVVTDSFHGMMMSTIFEKKCNLVIGTHEQRKQMSARLYDFTSDFGDPSIITETIMPSAAKKLSVTPKLNALIKQSKAWLAQAIG